MSERARARHDREKNAGHERYLRMRNADLFDVEREHGTEAAIDELETEDGAHHQREVPKREHAAKCHPALLGGVLGCRVRSPVVIHHPDHHEPDGVKERRRDECPP